MASGALITYLGTGPIGSRAATPDTYTGIPSLYYATDTNTLSVWDGSIWDDVMSANAYTIITESSAFTADPGTHDGLFQLIFAGGDVTFDNAEPYTSGMVFNIRATATIELIESSVTLTPPAGGTLELNTDMAVQVVMTGATTGIVIGQTVAA